MKSFLNFFFFLILSVAFVTSPSMALGKTSSRSGKFHINKEMKIKHTKAVILNSTTCQHKNSSQKCRDCSVNCCQLSVIGFTIDMAQPTQVVTQKVIISFPNSVVKDFDHGLFRPPIA